MTDPDITTKVGFAASARKAITAAVAAFASAFGPGLVIATADGSLTATDVVPIAITALGLAAGAFLAVYAIPNAKA